jgi:hypothetical protein
MVASMSDDGVTMKRARALEYPQGFGRFEAD